MVPRCNIAVLGLTGIGKAVGVGAVYHSTGSLLASRKVAENFGPEYECGDIITVRLSGGPPARPPPGKPQKSAAGNALLGQPAARSPQSTHAPCLYSQKHYKSTPLYSGRRTDPDVVLGRPMHVSENCPAPTPPRPPSSPGLSYAGTSAGLVLSFAVNGVWLKKDAALPVSSGPFVLAVQPYMGGVARIVEAVSTA